MSSHLLIEQDLVVATVGYGVKIKEGTNARAGVSQLAAGSVTIPNTTVTINTRVQAFIQALGTVTVPHAIGCTAKVPGTSFTLSSDDATDTSTVYWELREGA
jgi:hypothetical protein